MGIVDWDGVAALPIGFGIYGGYPGWITGDWDPLCIWMVMRTRMVKKEASHETLGEL